jgi:hypothetical protein
MQKAVRQGRSSSNTMACDRRCDAETKRIVEEGRWSSDGEVTHDSGLEESGKT